MKYQAHCLMRNFAKGCLGFTLALSMQTPICLQAAHADELAAETPVQAAPTADAPTTDTQAAPEEPKTRQLYGGVKKRDGHGLSGQVDENAPPTDPPLQAETAKEALFKLAVDKLVHHEKLSADEYRVLGFGTAGFECDNHFNSKWSTVSTVYKDSPADRAGIRVGDKVLLPIGQEARADHDANPTQELFAVTIKREGDKFNLHVLRDGMEVPLTLVDMNVEDIKESRYRKMWEGIIRELHFPDNGDFLGTTMHNMHPTDSEN